MTDNEIKQQLIELDSEYLYRDLGYGGFDENGRFIVAGEVITDITRDDLVTMLKSY